VGKNRQQMSPGKMGSQCAHASWKFFDRSIIKKDESTTEITLTDEILLKMDSPTKITNKKWIRGYLIWEKKKLLG
jgi:peptidyl-tRNA hydrolase